MITLLKWTLIAPASVYLVIVGIVYVFQRHLMYSPGLSTSRPADVGVPEMQVISVPTRDGLDIECWYAKSTVEMPTVVFFHGNAGTLADRAFKARIFLDAGYGVILAGYRGYGGNKGKPSEEGLYHDARAVISFLDGDRSGIIIYGESLGSGVAVHMAHELAGHTNDDDTQARLLGLVLEAPFTSMSNAAAYHYPWLPTRLLVWDRFDSIDKINSIAAPLLIIHGKNDLTVPYEHGITLYDAASEPKDAIWLSEAGHVNVYDHGAKALVLEWLGRYDKSRE